MRQLIDRMGSCVLGFDASGVQGGAMEAEIRRIVQTQYDMAKKLLSDKGIPFTTYAEMTQHAEVRSPVSLHDCASAALAS